MMMMAPCRCLQQQRTHRYRSNQRPQMGRRAARRKSPRRKRRSGGTSWRGIDKVCLSAFLNHSVWSSTSATISLFIPAVAHVSLTVVSSCPSHVVVAPKTAVDTSLIRFRSRSHVDEHLRSRSLPLPSILPQPLSSVASARKPGSRNSRLRSNTSRMRTSASRRRWWPRGRRSSGSRHLSVRQA